MTKPFNATNIDYRGAPEHLLVEACKSGEHPITVGGGFEFGRLVVRIANKAVIKYGRGVTASEATTQAYVHSCDASIFRVPELYHRFFENKSIYGSIGYLVMEFIEGITLDKIDEQLQLGLSARMATCLQHLWQLPVPADGRPGLLGGGEPRGKVWSDDGACTVFESLSDMDDWLNVSLEIDENLARIGRCDILDYHAPLGSVRDRLSLG